MGKVNEAFRKSVSYGKEKFIAGKGRMAWTGLKTLNTTTGRQQTSKTQQNRSKTTNNDKKVKKFLSKLESLRKNEKQCGNEALGDVPITEVQEGPAKPTQQEAASIAQEALNVNLLPSSTAVSTHFYCGSSVQVQSITVGVANACQSIQTPKDCDENDGSSSKGTEQGAEQDTTAAHSEPSEAESADGHSVDAMENGTSYDNTSNTQDSIQPSLERDEGLSEHCKTGLAEAGSDACKDPEIYDDRIRDGKEHLNENATGDALLRDEEKTTSNEQEALPPNEEEDIADNVADQKRSLLKQDAIKDDSSLDDADDVHDIYAEDEGLRRFEEVMESLDVIFLRELALKIRQGMLRESGSRTRVSSCEADSDPLYGTYNLVLVLTFDDGVEWIARFPGYGASPSALQIEKMELEYQTMRYVRSKTGFKMPDVYYWSTNTEEVGTAFGLISMIPGESLGDCWQEADFDEQKRLTAIAGVAAEMAKLYPLQFHQTGMLRFDEQGEVSHVDYEIEHWSTSSSPWGSDHKLGPFKNYTEWIRNHEVEIDRSNRYPKGGSIENVKMVLRSTPKFMRKAPLSMCLRDADLQNVLCDPTTGQITGFIDMDNMRVAPVIIGAAAYPRFLIKDRAPLKRQEELEAGVLYTSGDFLRYRNHYAKCFGENMPPSVHYDSRWTWFSDRTMILEDTIWMDPFHQFDVLQNLAWTAYFSAYGVKSRWRNDFKALNLRSFGDLATKKPLHKHRLRATIRDGLWKIEPANIPYHERSHTAELEKEAWTSARADLLKSEMDDENENSSAQQESKTRSAKPSAVISASRSANSLLEADKVAATSNECEVMVASSIEAHTSRLQDATGSSVGTAVEPADDQQNMNQPPSFNGGIAIDGTNFNFHFPGVIAQIFNEVYHWEVRD
ncbi:hypothetical protein OHC33_010672 [Knufia fluminis]|uniref:Aminoglycoside phosphotransferase domain-containing protein n=1 Tax=Knufia fluminis TaxID=191047 RepID=A0AAN8EJA7_9EURO|nr:hypothetical protein OHC33_010672 [Knufia fluminis]